MKIQFPYDGETVEMQFPDDTVILEGKKPAIIDDDHVRERLEAALRDYRQRFAGNPVLVVVNDATRRLPTAKILKSLLERLPLSSLEFIVATGTHRAPAHGEYEIIFGDLFPAIKNNVFVHDCNDDGSLVPIGYTSGGTPVIVNRKLYESRNLICINSIEPHFFAGYTGGRKSLIPGLAGFSTVVVNHSHAKSENAKSLNLESNPVHRDLEEAITLLRDKNILSIQMVASRQGEIAGIFCGELGPSFEYGVRLARDIYSVDIAEKYDIVFAIGEAPLDINLYQLQKAQEHGAEAVADGGILIVVGACSEGIGSPFFVNLTDEYPTPHSALSDKGLSDNRFGIHKLIKTARRLQRIKIWYVTKIDDNVIRKVYYEPQGSPQAALDEALKLKGESAQVAILRDACFLVPTII